MVAGYRPSFSYHEHLDGPPSGLSTALDPRTHVSNTR